MADTAARLTLAARRNEIARFTIVVTGIDMTGVAMAMQVRLGRDVPGAPLFALATVGSAAAEGLKLDSVTFANGIPTSTIKGRINASTMTDAAKVPYMGEIGSDSMLAYAMQWTISGDAQTRLYGDFVVLGSAFGSDNAPTNRPPSYGSIPSAGGSSSGSLQFGDQVIHVSVSGVEQLAALIDGVKQQVDVVSAGVAATGARVKAEVEASGAGVIASGAQVKAEVAAAAAAAKVLTSADVALSIGAAQAAKTAELGAKTAEAGAGRNKVDAQVAAARSDEILLAVQQAAAGGPVLPAGQRINTGDITIADLRALPAETPLGSIFIVSRPGLEGVWQVRAGNYKARTDADIFGTRYVKMAAWPAEQRAVERIVVGNLFRFSWTGMDGGTADVLPYLKAGMSLFDGHSKWELPAHRLALPGNADPTLRVPEGVHLYGFGRSTHFDYTGTTTNFFGLVHVTGSDTIVENIRLSGIAQNNSSNNPAVVAVTRPGDGEYQIDGVRIRGIEFDRTSTGIYVTYYSGLDAAATLKKPMNVDISEITGRNNGAAFSLFGAGAGTQVRDYDVQYDPTLPSASPAAIIAGFRILGSTDCYVHPGVVRDYSIGVKLDVAYAGKGSRAVNRNITLDRVRTYGTRQPYFLGECEGQCRIVAPVIRHSLEDTAARTCITLTANGPLSAMDPTDPDPRKTSIFGSLDVTDVDAEGYSLVLYSEGEMKNLSLRGGRSIGNACVSDSNGERGSVLVGEAGGLPRTVTVEGFDFMMTASEQLPTMVLRTSGGAMVIKDNVLPETQSGLVGVAALGGPVFTDMVPQRSLTGGLNLRSNTQHATGTLANWRDGTPIPVAPIFAFPWARNLVNIAEAPANRFTKSSGGALAYDAAVYSAERYVGDFELVYRLAQVTDEIFVGLDSAYGSTNYATIDHSIQYYLQGGESQYWRFNNPVRGVGRYTVDTIERWRRVGNRLIFSRNNVDLINVSVSAELPLGLQASIAVLGEAVEILRFAPL